MFAGNTAQFQASCFTSPSSTSDTDLAASTVAPAAEHYPNSTLHNSRRTAAADCVVRPTSSCQQIMSGCLFVFPCHLSAVVIAFEPRQKQRQEEQVEHVSLSHSLMSYKVLLHCTDAAQPLRLPGNHHWLGRTISCGCGLASPCVCVVASAMYVSMCVSRG